MKSIFICFLSAFESSLHSISLQTEIAKRLNVICAQLIPFLSQEVRWDQHTLSPTATHHDTHTCHVAFRRSVIDNSLTCALTHTISLFLFLTHMQSHFFFFLSLFLSYFLTLSHSFSFWCLWEAYCYSCKPTSTKTLTVCPKLFLTRRKTTSPSCFKCVYSYKMQRCLCVCKRVHTHQKMKIAQYTKTH